MVSVENLELHEGIKITSNGNCVDKYKSFFFSFYLKLSYLKDNYIIKNNILWRL